MGDTLREDQLAPPDERWKDLTFLVELAGTRVDAGGATKVGRGWRALEPGPQALRVRFDEPLRISRIRIAFDEPTRARTQEFALRWSAADGGFHQLVRQQYVFSPPETSQEVETYDFDLEGVRALEIVVVPDISGAATPVGLTGLFVSE